MNDIFEHYDEGGKQIKIEVTEKIEHQYDTAVLGLIEIAVSVPRDVDQDLLAKYGLRNFKLC